MKKVNSEIIPPRYYKDIKLGNKTFNLKIFEEAYNHNIKCKIENDEYLYQEKGFSLEFDGMIGEELNTVYYMTISFAFFLSLENPNEYVMDMPEIIKIEHNLLTVKSKIYRPCDKNKFDYLQFELFYRSYEFGMLEIRNETQIKNTLN